MGRPIVRTAITWPRAFRSRLRLAVVAVLMPMAVFPDPEVPTVQLELEGGALWQSRNEVRIPNDASATRFSLVDVTSTGPWPAGRLYASWNLSGTHQLRLLAAPLSVTESGALDTPVSFAGGRFAAGVPTTATYRFNSWRLGYRYRFRDGERWTGWIGLTAKIRDAEVRLEQAGEEAAKTDLGFVPLLHIAGRARLTPRWRAEAELEGLAGGPGRAVDASLKLGYRLDDRFDVKVGYRTVEGGADVDAVYNFAWLHAAVVSVSAAL